MNIFKSFANTWFIFFNYLLNVYGAFISFEKLKEINPATNILEYAYFRNSVRTTLYSQYFYIPKLNIQEYKPVIPINIYFSKNE